MPEVQFLQVGDDKIALRHRDGNQNPGLVWLGGYGSDMLGTKASYLDNFCAERGSACLRHDYSGHGESSGNFMEGTISRWLTQSLAVYQAKAQTTPSAKQILVGSSMGGWIALRMAQELQKRHDLAPLAAIILLAPAPDFTATMIEPSLSEEKKQLLQNQGFLELKSEYGTAVYTHALIEDGRNNLVQKELIETGCPVHIIHGCCDETVSYQHSLDLLTYLPRENVTLTLVKDGDHRLSRPQDLALLGRIIEPFFSKNILSFKR